VRSPSGDVLAPVDLDDQRALLRIARRAIEVGLAGEGRALHDDERSGRLGEPGASFVTLRQDDDLLGCIGTMEASRALADDVAANAHAAAFADPRLPPVTWEQLAVLSIKISVLGPLVRMPVASADELRATVRPHVDGLLITDGRRRATFLPSVWDTVGDVDTFLGMLWQKAGLHPGVWPRRLAVFRYATFEFGD
jgi:AmmeMemoRadiSam system protein A